MKSIRRHIVCRNQQKRHPEKCRIILSLLMTIILSFSVSAQENLGSESEYLIYLSGQSTFYAEQDYILQWDKGKDYWKDTKSFIVRVSFANQTIVERHLTAQFPLKFMLHYPRIRPGVIAEATLTISAYFNGQVQKGVHKQTIFAYSKEHPIKWGAVFKDSVIGVLDQTEDKTLIQFLDNLNIPFTKVYSLSDFTGQWMICGGIDIGGNNSLFDKLYSLMQRDVTIIVLPPIKGSFNLPPHKKGRRLTMGDEDIIKDMDKRFNLETINNQSDGAEVTFQEKSLGEYIGIEISPNGEGFSWFELAEGNARMIFCGWNLTDLHEQNPTAALLLRHLLLVDQK